jgi:tetratricopeptide (TPR) repeat protein
VLPRLATVDVLRLMRRPVDSRIDFDLARTIATREGLKAVLDGDIVSHGGRYLVSTRLISADGQELATFNESAESDNDLIPAVGRLGKQIRAKAGESLKQVRESGALDRVTTGSLEALRRYAAANLAFDQAGDYQRAIALFREAVNIDSTFAMAWRRLGLYYSNQGRLEEARDAIAHAYRFVDRLGESERQLTTAAYYSAGPEPNDQRALDAYEALIARDSLNAPALNNAGIYLTRKGELEKALRYTRRASVVPGRAIQAFGNSLGYATALGRWEVADSIVSDYVRAYPTNPVALFAPATLAYARGQLDSAAALSADAQQHFPSSIPYMQLVRDFDGDLALTRGRIRQGQALHAEARAIQSHANRLASQVTSLVDSVSLVAQILEDPQRARALLDRGLRRVALDSIPLIDRGYFPLIQLAAQLGDSARAREWTTGYKAQLAELGRVTDGAAIGELADASLAIARGRFDEALTHLHNSERLSVLRPDFFLPMKFMVVNRLQMADSAIATGEEYVAITFNGRLPQDALYLATTHQRLGELYEQKGNVDKALEHYNAFVELWKDADPELQSRVKDVRGRIARLQRSRG